ncbi:MAG: hypothetical protein P9X22_04525 [Candidatus Zapsychrus exili]|nr:hypothetical protein [Candidatus Zapsychrus exili]
MKNNKNGQNIVEYLLIFSIVVLIIFIALGPNGFMTKSIKDSLDTSISGIESMANNLNYEE